MRKYALRYVLLCLLGLVAFGCNSTDTVEPHPVPSTLPTPFPGFTFPLVDLANRVLPLPNNFLLDPATGLINLPGGGGTADNTINAANSLDGFSTTGPIVIPFRGTVVPSTVNANTLPVYNTATGQPALVTYSVSDAAAGSVVTIVPVQPLDPETTYVVVLTKGIISALSNTPILSDNVINFIQQPTPLVDGQGVSTTRLLTDEQAQTLEPVRQGNQPVIAAAEGLTGTNRANIPFAFAFTTQTLFQALPVARDVVQTTNAGLVNTTPGGFPIATQDGVPNVLPSVAQLFGLLGVPAQVPNDDIGLIYRGTVSVPQFRADQLTDFWSNPPVQTGTTDVTFILCMPDPVAFPPPRPAVIFQHGVTRNKGDMFVLADAFNALGFATIAIDLPLHGDLKADPNGNDGDGFINPAAPRVSRDNIRQGVVGLYALNNAIFSGQTDLNGDMVPELVPGAANSPFNRPLFIGTSLGAMIGTVYTATEPNANRAVLNVPGGRIVNLLVTSPTFGPPILAGLANLGIQPGTSDFARFVIFTQAVLDDVDPLNYGQPAVAGTLRGGEGADFLQQVALDDTVITPESQFDLSNAFGEDPSFVQVAAVVPLALVTQAAAPSVGPGVFEVPNAEHGALLNPAAGPTAQIVTQAITFLGQAQIIDAGLRAREVAEPVAPTDPAPYQRAVGF